MSTPASYDRVLALLKRLSPVFPSTDSDKAVGKELASIALAIATATDPLDDVLDESFPDTADALLDRWEAITRVPSRSGADLDARRALVLAVMRRAAGTRLDQLAALLSGPLDLAVDDITFVETYRQTIDDALTEDSGEIDLAIPCASYLGREWPNEVDDRGVRVLIDGSSDAVTYTLTSPSGTVWDVSTGTVLDGGWVETRSAFLGEKAGGLWLLTADGLSGTLSSWKLLVSNTIDSAQIYNFHVRRDPDLPGTPDLAEAQRLFRRSALAHMLSKVYETDIAICDDPHSLCDRDLVGA